MWALTTAAIASLASSVMSVSELYLEPVCRTGSTTLKVDVGDPGREADSRDGARKLKVLARQRRP